MFKDFNDPYGNTFYKASKLYEMPDFVKEASAEDEDCSSLPTMVFADTVDRRYPLHNKAAAWMSRMYIETDSSKLDPLYKEAVLKRIKWAEKLWGLEPLVKKEAKADDSETKVIGLSFEGQEVHKVSIRDSLNWKEAAESLVENKANMPYTIRRQLAEGLLSTPQSLKGDNETPEMRSFLEKTAGYGVCSRDQARDAILRRAYNSRNTETRNTLCKVASALPEYPERSLLVKVAEALDTTDRETGLSSSYDNGFIKKVEDELFTVSLKEASEKVEDSLQLTDGTVISKAALLDKKSDIRNFFESYFGEVPFSNDSEMLEQVAALPKPDAEALFKAVNM